MLLAWRSHLSSVSTHVISERAAAVDFKFSLSFLRAVTWYGLSRGSDDEKLQLLDGLLREPFLFCPYTIVSGDFNLDPLTVAEFLAHSGFPFLVFYPEQATCKSDGEWRTIDFFLVSVRMAKFLNPLLFYMMF